ncbi:E3 ubiquitin-protein ligase At1g12760-like isoform X3 [Phragmites australis]|uniref:E3 ubiquitin-protein ligase At1g12760-like isoform X3 n=1 Tax=Phragmites australis TaxID=29695 RepID=UPI002D7849C1|nr:E3 ubiquitin-protein ligase At1g12760-like isoform X3 [Phragmites australis]
MVIAAIVILIYSRHEHPHAPLFAWIIGYTVGCIASLPLVYWRYVHRNRPLDQEPQQPPTTYPALTPAQSSEGRNHRASGTVLHLGCIMITCPRLSILAYHFKTAVDCFFAVWFVVGNVWIFGGRSISSDAQDAPNMYRLCLSFLALSCVGYAIPFIMCAAICCCFPCLISVLRLQEDLGQTRGATQELIDALPTYKFKPKRNKNWGIDHASSSENLDEGGILGPGTKKERVVSAEDAVCCICLTKYGDDDELRELPCAHFFHVQCVDKWLKINAVCPLCKTEIGGVVRSIFGLPFGRRRVDRMAGRGVASSRFNV